MELGSIALACLAGVLSVLSPCVLPLLPIVFGSAAGEHRAGPLSLAAGVALSFVLIGLFVATLGFSINLDTDVFRTAAAWLMLGAGLVLMIPSLQMRLAVAGGPLSDWADRRIAGAAFHGWTGQFGIGILLGAVWSPCVGPTLGAASVLAAQGASLGSVGLTMLAFGLGAAMPLMLIGQLSRGALMRSRNWMIAGGKGAKTALGAVLIGLAILILSGYDKRVETQLVDWSPDWLTRLTTRF